MKPERCSHSIGGAMRCHYCGWKTCAICHHGPQHLKQCSETKLRETRQ